MSMGMYVRECMLVCVHAGVHVFFFFKHPY